MEPKSELARYAFGYSDKKPGWLFWAIHAAMIAYIVFSAIGAAHATTRAELACMRDGPQSEACEIAAMERQQENERRNRH